MIKDVVVRNGLLGVATGTFVCMVGNSYGGSARPSFIRVARDSLRAAASASSADVRYGDFKAGCRRGSVLARDSLLTYTSSRHAPSSAATPPEMSRRIGPGSQ